MQTKFKQKKESIQHEFSISIADPICRAVNKWAHKRRQPNSIRHIAVHINIHGHILFCSEN